MLIIAPTLRVPYPIVLVIGGVAVGFLPGMPELELPPDLVLIAVLPPLLYAGTFFTSLHELKLNMRPIGLLSVGLVIMTTVVVAAVAHATIDGLSWSSAFVLGAVVSPTDPIAATAMARRFGVPRRLVSIVEGESLINDGTALVAYRFAVVAVVTGAFSIWEAGLEFLYSVSVGIAIGLGVGWLVRHLRRRLDNPPVEITIALLSAYIAAIPAELVHASAVLAAVTVGVYVGAHTSELTTARTRVQSDAVWDIVVFLLNALLFVLIGLQLPVILDELSGRARRHTALLRPRRLGDRHRRPDRRDVRRHVSPPVPQPPHPRARPLSAVAAPCVRRLVGHAGSGNARGGARATPDHRRGRSVSGA